MAENRTIRDLRKACGLTQPVVAQRLGISVPAYSRKETGKRPWRVRELYELAALFGVPPAVVFSCARELTDEVSEQRTSA